MDTEEQNSEDYDLFGASNIGPDIETSPDECNPFSGGFDSYAPFFQQEHPTNSQWRDIESPNAYNTYATIDGAHQQLWNQGKSEINFARNKVKEALATLGKSDPSLSNLVDLMYGPKSNIGRMLGEKLKISNEELMKNLGTYFLAAAYNLSKKQTYNKHSFVNMEGLSDEKDYQAFWNSVALTGCAKGNSHVRGVRPLWIDVEHALNETLRELFVEGVDFYIRITIDDDKVHYEITGKQLAQGLKIAQHVRDNRKGFVVHTSCFTASGLPIGIAWERLSDDTTASATERLIRTQLSPMSGLNGPPMLSNTQFCMDRGYWAPALLFDFLTPSGADVLGTVKRCPMFPFTYDQRLAQNDKRQLIDTNGFKALFMKKLTVQGKQITGVAYRDGKGGVTLGLTSSTKTRHWDLVLANPLDAKRQVSDKGLQWYKSIDGEEHETYHQLFNNLPVVPFTVKQNTPEWFLLQTFAFTSSASDNLLAEVKKMIISEEMQNFVDGNTWEALFSILTIIYGVGWDRKEMDLAMPSATIPVPPIPNNEVVEAEPDSAVVPVLIDGMDINANVQILMSGEALNTGLEDELNQQISSNTITEGVLRAYLEKIGLKAVKERKKNLDKFKKWLDTEPVKRPYINLTKSKLIEECIHKFGGKKSTYESCNNEHLICRLATYQNNPSFIALQNQRAQYPQPEGAALVGTTLLKQIVKSSFLPRLTAKGKEFCKLGHELELPFVIKLLKHSDEGLTKFTVEKIYRVGLLGKKDELYAKASCDFIAGVIVEGENLLVGVECKARLSPGTDQRERLHTEFLSHFHGMSLASPAAANTATSIASSVAGTPASSSSSTSTTIGRGGAEMYTIIEAASADFHIYVDSSHEAVQLLHQAYVCSFQYVLLLVGDRSGNIIRGKCCRKENCL